MNPIQPKVKARRVAKAATKSQGKPAAETPRTGCAGWNLLSHLANQFDKDGSHLERYASRFSAVEINSSFYKPHRLQTYERWAATVPADFRFSVKVPKQITHELGLRNAGKPLREFLEGVAGLGSKLGVLLVQLPRSLEFQLRTAKSFFTALRDSTATEVVCEPRHPSWFATKAVALLEDFHIGLVNADPTPAGCPETPPRTAHIAYYRLHGSPQIYYSRYSSEFLRNLSQSLLAQPNAWCIFDNTAAGWAVPNALELNEMLGGKTARPRLRGTTEAG